MRQKNLSQKDTKTQSSQIATWIQPFLLFLFLNYFRHRSAANQAEIYGAAKRAEMANVEQLKKIVPLITRAIPFSQYVCEMMFGVNVTDLNIGVQIDSVKQPIQFRETCLIVGLRPLIIILITASLSTKTYNIALAPECIVYDEMWSMLVGMTLVCLN